MNDYSVWLKQELTETNSYSELSHWCADSSVYRWLYVEKFRKYDGKKQKRKEKRKTRDVRAFVIFSYAERVPVWFFFFISSCSSFSFALLYDQRYSEQNIHTEKKELLVKENKGIYNCNNEILGQFYSG